MKRKIKYFLTPVIASICLFVVGGIAVANDDVTDEIVEEIETINSEDIGIEIIDEEVEEDNEDISEEDDAYESDEEMDDEVDEDVDVEIESPEPPEGMCEGYEEGNYFEPNHFGDCELHEYCYICPTCTIEEDVYTDVDDVGNTIWMVNKSCIVCGHGTCEDVTEEYTYNFNVSEDDIEDEDVEYDIIEEFDYEDEDEDEVVEDIVE